MACLSSSLLLCSILYLSKFVCAIVPSDGVNMSLGLSMSKTETSPKTVVGHPSPPIPSLCRPFFLPTLFLSCASLSFFLLFLTFVVGQVCGPTIPKECDSINLYGGMCFSISPSLQQDGPLPSSLEGRTTHTILLHTKR